VAFSGDGDALHLLQIVDGDLEQIADQMILFLVGNYLSDAGHRGDLFGGQFRPTAGHDNIINPGALSLPHLLARVGCSGGGDGAGVEYQQIGF
jgi:hypothetical protein